MGGRHSETAESAARRWGERWRFDHIVRAAMSMAILALMALPPGVVLIGGAALGHYDNEHPTTMNCTTTTAESRRGKYGGLSILVRTEDCGDLSLRPIDRDDVDATIRDIQHARVRFSIGEGSLNLISAFRAIGVWPTVTSYTVVARSH